MLRGSGCGAAPAVPQAAAGEPSRGLHELQGGKETVQGLGMRLTDRCGGPTEAVGHTSSQWNHAGSQWVGPPVVSPMAFVPCVCDGSGLGGFSLFVV